MSKNRRIVKNSSILYIKLIIISIAGLIFSRLILNRLGASDYGLYNVVAGFVGLLNLSNLFMVGATYRFISYEIGKGNAGDVNKIFNISLWLHLGIALIAYVLSETVGMYYISHYLNVPASSFSDAIFVFRFSVLVAVISIISVPYQAVMTAYEEFVSLSLIEVLSVIFKVIIAFALFAYSGNKLRLFSFLMFIVLSFFSLAYIGYCRKRHRQIVQWRFYFDKFKSWEMLCFAGWSSMGSLVFMGRVQGVALLINYFFGTILNASFGIANQVNQVLLTFSQSVGQAVAPQIIQSYSGGDHDRATKLVCYVNKYSFLVMLFPAFMLLLEMDYFLKIWLVEVPQYTSIFCKLMLINALLDCLCTSGTTAYVQATGDIKIFQIGLGASMLLTLPIAYVFFKLGYRPHVILIIQLFSTLLGLLTRLILLKLKYKFDVGLLLRISIFRNTWVIVLLLPLFALKIFYPGGIARVLATGFLFVIAYCLIVYIVALESREKQILHSKWNDFYLNLVKIF